MNNSDEKLSLLESVFGSSMIAGSEERLFFCPFCHHHKRKLSINIKKNCYKCWTCDVRGKDIFQLLKRKTSQAKQDRWRELSGQTEILDDDAFSKNMFDENKQKEERFHEIVQLPKEFVSLTGNKLPATAMPATAYLKHRKVKKEDIVRWKMGYCFGGEYANRIIVPSFDLQGNPDYFVGRSYEDDVMKYKNPPVTKNIVFNELYLDFAQPISLVEGVFDAINAGDNAVPILGSSLKEDSRLFQQIALNDTKVYMALDPDAEKKSVRLIAKMLEYGVEIFKVSIFPYHDVGEMSKQEFLKRKDEAKRITDDSLISYLWESV